jgi:hypothetical protein
MFPMTFILVCSGTGCHQLGCHRRFRDIHYDSRNQHHKYLTHSIYVVSTGDKKSWRKKRNSINVFLA